MSKHGAQAEAAPGEVDAGRWRLLPLAGRNFAGAPAVTRLLQTLDPSRGD